MTETRTERIRSDIENLAGFSAVEGMGCTRYSYLSLIHISEPTRP